MASELKNTESASAELISITRASTSAWVPVIGFLSMGVLSLILLARVVNPGKVTTFGELLGRITWSISVLFFVLTVAVTFVTTFQVIGNTSRSTKIRIGGGLALFIGTAIVMLYLLPGNQEFAFNKGLLVPTVYAIAPPVEKFVVGVQMLGTLALTALAIAVSLILSRADRTSDHHDNS